MNPIIAMDNPVYVHVYICELLIAKRRKTRNLQLIAIKPDLRYTIVLI